ncbi:MAG: hydrogenase, partial [Deltaproteobacteria bacterium]|nr:hydrogenase [Deltaproteobacteria bacterium]
NVLVPQLFWFRSMRRNITVMFVTSLFVNLGMWFERYTIIVTSLHRDFLPANWWGYMPTYVEMGITLGSFGFFFTFFLLFCRVLPTIAMSEIKSTMHTFWKPAGKKKVKVVEPEGEYVF